MLERKVKKTNIKIGDWVRISRQKGIFEKGYLPRWSAELFKVITIVYDDPVRYEIEDYDGEHLKGSFYEQELQKVKYHDIWLVDKVLKTRNVKGDKQIFVSWVGMSPKYNSWISEKETILLK